MALISAVALVVLVGGSADRLPTATAASPNEATLYFGSPSDLDPALQGDVASARVTAQLYESLTALDPARIVRPALADSWQVLDGGQRIVFTMRSGLTFSDGSPLTSADVVRSWLRVIDPSRPSPLASLAANIVGADAYLHGQSRDPTSVGVRDLGGSVEVRLVQPSADFPAIVASPSFAIVPRGFGSVTGGQAPGAGFVASGAYRLSAVTADELTLAANPHYWAGQPPIATIHLLTTLGGQSPVDVFSKGTVDYTPVNPSDAAWIRYDSTLGPSLRDVASMSVTYYGFDTSRPPFNDVRVRRAFATALDWKRIVSLVAGGTSIGATSMVPPGVPGRTEHDFSPAFDLAQARADLAAAGFPGGAGFPAITMVTEGSTYDEAVVASLQTALGVTLHYEVLDSGYLERLMSDPPAIWMLGWVADYPGPNDFLGLLLGTGSTNNYGRWSSTAFDTAIADAVSATDPAATRAAYDRAETIVQQDVPLVPVSYDAEFALAQKGLLGAAENGLGIIRLAGLAWAGQ